MMLKLLPAAGLVVLWSCMTATGCGDSDTAGTNGDAGVDGAVDAAETDADSGSEIDAATDADVEIDREVLEITDLPGMVGLYYFGINGLAVGAAENVTVEIVGLEHQYTTTTDEDGEFVLYSVPVGRTVYLRATGLPNTRDGISRVFTIRDTTQLFLAMATDELIDQVSSVWNVTQEAGAGLLVGLVGRYYPPMYDFHGDAVAVIDPIPTGENYQLIYYNPQNPTDTSLTATHENRSMFLGFSIPPTGVDDPYSMTATHDYKSFDNVEFFVEPDKLTFVEIRRLPD